MRNRCNRIKVVQVTLRVSNRFGEDTFGLVIDQGRDVLGIARISVTHFDTKALQGVGK